MRLEREPVGERQWLALLRGLSVGRLIYTVGALPAVLPVRFHLTGDGLLLLHAPAAAGLDRAVDGAVVAFEAGEVSDDDGSGWSVTVLGHATAPDGDGVIGLTAELVTGRRLPPVASADPG